LEQEFEKYFKETCQKLGIEQYWSRPRTPKDNPEKVRDSTAPGR